MSAKLSKWLGTHPNLSEGLFQLTHTELAQDLNITCAFTAFQREARGRRGNGKGRPMASSLAKVIYFAKE